MKPVSPIYDSISGIPLCFSFKGRLGMTDEQDSGIVGTQVF